MSHKNIIGIKMLCFPPNLSKWGFDKTIDISKVLKIKNWNLAKLCHCFFTALDVNRYFTSSKRSFKNNDKDNKWV